MMSPMGMVQPDDYLTLAYRTPRNERFIRLAERMRASGYAETGMTVIELEAAIETHGATVVDTLVSC